MLFQAFRSWGELLRQYHDKTSEYRDSDLTINYLGYWTDKGGYYFYNTEPDMNYEETMIAVKKDADANGIPYKCAQFSCVSELYRFVNNLVSGTCSSTLGGTTRTIPTERRSLFGKPCLKSFPMV